MQAEKLVTKITQVIQREDGSQARIVAENFAALTGGRSIDVYVHRRESPDHEWKLCSDRPHPDWRKMSVADYIKHGRSEMLQTVSQGEILKATSALGQPLANYR